MGIVHLFNNYSRTAYTFLGEKKEPQLAEAAGGNRQWEDTSLG